MIFVDECLIMYQNHLYFLHRILHQIKYNDTLIVEGVVVVLIGERGKLPVVSKRILWDRNPKT